MKRLVVLLALTLSAFGCATEQRKENAAAFDNAPPASSGPTGRIRGMVRLQGALPPAAVETVKEHQEICGHEVTLPRIVLGEGNGVQDAFVYLDGVHDGRSFPRPPSVLIDQRQCQYSPHVMIVPVGTRLESSAAWLKGSAMSTSSTSPGNCCARAAARLMAIVVRPEPPFGE